MRGEERRGQEVFAAGMSGVGNQRELPRQIGVRYFAGDRAAGIIGPPVPTPVRRSLTVSMWPQSERWSASSLPV